MRWVLLAALLVFSAGCEYLIESEPSQAVITFNLQPRNKIKTAVIDPRTECVSLKISTEDGSFSKKVAVSRGTASISVPGVPPGEVIVDLLLTDGAPTNGVCSGNKIDQINTKARVTPGRNTITLSFPRAKWIIQGGPISLNITDPSATETVNGFIVYPHRSPPQNNGYVNNSIIFFGNLPQCDPVLGQYCGTRTEISSIHIPPDSTEVILGNEFSGYPAPATGWIPIKSSGADPRYLILVSKPPCSYKRPPNMIDCSYTMNPDLSQKMGLRFTDGSTLQGYIWEVLVKSASEAITCYSDKNLSSPIACPPEISSFPYQFESQSLGHSQHKNIRVQQLVTGVQATVNKVFEEFSFSLGSLIYVKISRSMTFDLGLHNITAKAQNLINLSPFYLFYQNGASPFANIVPLNLNGSKLSPIGANDIAYPFMVPYFIFSDSANLQYTGFNPLYLVFIRGGSLYKVSASGSLSSPQQLSAFSSANICYVQSVNNPIKGVAHVFIRELGADMSCFTSDDPIAYINTNMLPIDNPLTVPYFRDIVGLFFSGTDIQNFLLFDDIGGKVIACNEIFTSCVLLLNVSSFIEVVGYSFKANKTYLVVDGSLYAFNGTTVQFILNPVDTCTLTESTIYCAYTDPTTAETKVYVYDPVRSASSIITRFPASGNADGLLPLTNYILLRYVSQTGSYGYIAIDLKTGDISGVNFPVGRNPYLAYSTGITAIGMDQNSGTFQEFCYVKESDLPNGTCLSRTFIPANFNYFNSGPIQDPPTYGLYNKGHNKLYVVLECARSGVNCPGGVIHEFNKDLVGSSPIFNVPSDEEVREIVKLGTGLLVFTENLALVPPTNRKVYFIDTLNRTTITLEGSPGEFYPVTISP